MVGDLTVCHLIAIIPVDDISVIHEEDNENILQSHQPRLDQNLVSSILRVMSIAIGGLYLSFSREIALKNMVTKAVSNLHALHHDVEDLTSEKVQLTW